MCRAAKAVFRVPKYLQKHSHPHALQERDTNKLLRLRFRILIPCDCSGTIRFCPDPQNPKHATLDTPLVVFVSSIVVQTSWRYPPEGLVSEVLI